MQHHNSQQELQGCTYDGLSYSLLPRDTLASHNQCGLALMLAFPLLLLLCRGQA